MNSGLNKAIRLSGLSQSQIALCLRELFLYGDFLPFFRETAYPKDRERISPAKTTLVVTANASFAEQLVSDLSFFTAQTGISICKFLPWEVLPFDGLSPTASISAERLESLAKLLSPEPIVLVTSAEALLQKIVSVDKMRRLNLDLSVGQSVDREELLVQLDNFGYLRSRIVEEVGQMAVRGSVVDIFPPATDCPYRIEFFDDRIESIRKFKPADQRSLQAAEQIKIIPVREFFRASSDYLDKLRARADELELPLSSVRSIEEALSENVPYPGIEHLLALFEDDLSSLLDYLPKSYNLILCDQLSIEAQLDDYSEIIAERAERAKEEGRIFPKPEEAFLRSSETLAFIKERADCVFDEIPLMQLLEQREESLKKSIACYGLQSLRTALQLAKSLELPFAPLAEEIKQRQAQGYQVCIAISQHGRRKRIQELLETYQISSSLFEGNIFSLSEVSARVHLLEGAISSGIRIPSLKLEIISERDIFPDTKRSQKAALAKNIRRFLGAASQLQADDYVVHVDHGVAIYRGLKEIAIEGKPGDFLVLEYANKDKLFIPVDNIGKVQKYIAKEGLTPALSQLGNKNWEKAKEKVQREVVELAGQLITLYAKREIAQGYAFTEVDEQDHAFADSFPYEETADQQSAIDDVLNDMAQSKPMDRLVCGDVGYGKTEVAMRASFKAVNQGRQVAILVPTTILADQHFANFKERFEPFGISVGCLSRFFSSAENRATLVKAAEGKVDIVIGTHRLIQKDVNFKDLGLIIIDEEHRFGVAHKEKLKRFRESVDVLTLTATPIPRTLHMSLSGIRDLSVIETPPHDRQLTRTYMAQYEPNIVREAIMRELGRQGQAFYIYNRVQNIALIADELAELVPEARIAFAHGQMKEGELEVIMHKFVSHEVDVLVSTTIVESGLDISNANTMIIRNAERFGLAELYQLRGRVGRSSRRAYAYLLVADPKTLGADARRRLQVLKSLDDLGVGFRLALQDMEIRGAGNLLGKDQSGQISAVGYELYSRILRETVESMRRGEVVDSKAKALPQVDPEVNIGFPAYIPPFYIPDLAERLLLYQRLVCILDEAEGEDLAEEIQDRFGGMPNEMQYLLALMVFRSLLKRAAIVSAKFKAETLTVNFHPEMSLNSQLIMQRIASSNGRLKISPTMAVSIVFEKKPESPWDLHGNLKRILESLGVNV